ncbi:hypothetical protein HY285_03560 [Candidatus Peregrinibacteria bacterium]|nr:hypothetical protein [Candidatus Peregrinibacteria bacterium]MBI3816593.1 hypothetical protein [Candidatus Peregrinibacteria bacterium]
MQTSIAIDGQTRDRAAKRAKAQRLPLAAVVRILLNDYADGRLNIETHTIAESIPVDARTQKSMDKVVQQWRARIDA